jgi:hypothetical protein
VFILKGVKVVYFDTDLEVLIIKVLMLPRKFGDFCACERKKNGPDLAVEIRAQI